MFGFSWKCKGKLYITAPCRSLSFGYFIQGWISRRCLGQLQQLRLALEGLGSRNLSQLSATILLFYVDSRGRIRRYTKTQLQEHILARPITYLKDFQLLRFEDRNLVKSILTFLHWWKPESEVWKFHSIQPCIFACHNVGMNSNSIFLRWKFYTCTRYSHRIEFGCWGNIEWNWLRRLYCRTEWVCFGRSRYSHRRIQTIWSQVPVIS